MANEEFTAFLDTSDEWIHSHTGIRNRHIADPDQNPSDLAYAAGRKVLDQAGVAAEEIDLVLVATATGDYLGFPSVACLVQDQLGAKRAGAMDLAAGCTGFIYGLETARNFVAGGGARNVLVIGAEVLSRIVDWQDRNTCVLFGDGAGAALVSAVDGARDGSGRPRGLIASMLRADGGGAHLLERPMGGTRTPFTPENFERTGTCLKMDGRQVYNFAVKAVAEGIPELLAAHGFTIDDVAWIVPHQANVRIIEAAAKRAKIPMEKYYLNIEEYANTSAASIPIALTEMRAKGLL
ncbi:MAG TPA: beta-ketoacyl-ACP synthase III, partial [Desulfobacterales bacterium]|nr:beta-ketoacyl-ACP synthase III [Desulfobacterales bacterium]